MSFDERDYEPADYSGGSRESFDGASLYIPNWVGSTITYVGKRLLLRRRFIF